MELEFAEIRRDGWSGQLDRESMDYILRDNGVVSRELRRRLRSIWIKMSSVMGEASKKDKGSKR